MICNIKDIWNDITYSSFIENVFINKQFKTIYVLLVVFAIVNILLFYILYKLLKKPKYIKNYKYKLLTKLNYIFKTKAIF